MIVIIYGRFSKKKSDILTEHCPGFLAEDGVQIVYVCSRSIRLCSKALKTNNTLTQLNLERNQIGDIGGTAIGEALGF